jgi:hypothetical protein
MHFLRCILQHSANWQQHNGANLDIANTMHFIEFLLCLPTNALHKFVGKHNRNNGTNFLKNNKTGGVCIT